MPDKREQCCRNCKWFCDVGKNDFGWCALREVHYRADDVCSFYDARESNLDDKKGEGDKHAE